MSAVGPDKDIPTEFPSEDLKIKEKWIREFTAVMESIPYPEPASFQIPDHDSFLFGNIDEFADE